MNENQVYQSIPIYNDIQSLKTTIKQLESIATGQLSKIYLTSTDGIGLDLSNFNSQFSQSLVLSILEYKREQLAKFQNKLSEI